MSNAVADGRARHQQNMEVLYSIGLLVASAILVFNLTEIRWVVPITLGHIAALASVWDGFRMPGFRPVATKTSFTILALIATVFALAGGGDSSSTKTTGETPIRVETINPPLGGGEDAVRPSPKEQPLPIPSQTMPQETLPAPQPAVADAQSRARIREVSTTVDEVLKTYAGNQIAGERKFSNARVSIKGRVIRVRETLGTGVLILGSIKSSKRIDLHFAESGEESLGQVEPGQIVESVCYEALEIMGEVSFHDCRSVK